MEKNAFHEEAGKIDVPKEDVMKAIQTGIRKGAACSWRAKRKKRIKVFSISAAAIIALFSSGFIFPVVSHVMADIPFLAKLYEHDQVATSLESQRLITKLDEKASYGGVDVTVTDAYYDGAMIGVTFDVKGDMGDSKEMYAFYEIFHADPHIQETKELVKLLPIDGGYKGHIQLSYPRGGLPVETTLPLKFLEIGKIGARWKEAEGKWNFDVPLKQLPHETILLGEESRMDGYKVKLEKRIDGKSSSALEYSISYPAAGKHDSVRLELFNDKGKQLIGGTSDSKIGKKTENGMVLERRRLTIPWSLEGNFIKIQPILYKGENGKVDFEPIVVHL